MALASKDAVGGNLPPFFNPGDFTDAIAIIFEPKKIQHGVPGKWGPRTHVTAQMSVFKNEPQLEEGRPVVQTVTINTKSIAETLEEAFNEDKNAAVIALVKPYKPEERWPRHVRAAPAGRGLLRPGRGVLRGPRAGHGQGHRRRTRLRLSTGVLPVTEDRQQQSDLAERDRHRDAGDPRLHRAQALRRHRLELGGGCSPRCGSPWRCRACSCSSCSSWSSWHSSPEGKAVDAHTRPIARAATWTPAGRCHTSRRCVTCTRRA